MTFSHVAVASSGITNGINNSVSAPIVAEENQTHETTLSVPSSNLLVQNKDNLRIVALLVSRTRGNIVNAAVTRISEPTGIATHTSDGSTSPIIVDMQGRCLREVPARGIYIQNGKKVLR